MIKKSIYNKKEIIMAKKGKKTFKYKQLGEEKYEELKGMKDEELHKEVFNAQRAEDVLKKKRKDDEKLNKLKDEIKSFIDENMPDSLLRELDKVMRDKKQTIKEIKDDKKIKDTVMDLHILQGEHNKDILFQKQKQKAILEILRKREQNS